MQEVLLTVGPRASGKSTYCDKMLTLDPTMTLISRDQILVELFGKTTLNSYSGGHYHAAQIMWERMANLVKSNPELTLLFDCWNGESRERKYLIGKLRDLGFEKVSALYFITPVEFVEQWFWQKPGIAKISEMRKHPEKKYTYYSEWAPSHDYNLFHEYASDIEGDGFDQIIYVDARQLFLPYPVLK